MSHFDDEIDRIVGNTPSEPDAPLEHASLEPEPKNPVGRPKSTLKQRKANRDKQRRWAERQKEARAAELAAITQESVRTRNRSALSDVELANLEMRQSALAEIGGSMLKLIADLELGKVPGENTYFVDTLYEEVQAYIQETNPNGGLVVHVSQEDFTNLQLPENKKVLALLSGTDRIFWTYGYYTKIPTWLWTSFIKSIVIYFRSHPDDDSIDRALANQAIAEWYRLHPYESRHHAEHVNLTEKASLEAHRRRVLGEERQAESANEKERIKTQMDLLKFPNRKF